MSATIRAEPGQSQKPGHLVCIPQDVSKPATEPITVAIKKRTVTERGARTGAHAL